MATFFVSGGTVKAARMNMVDVSNHNGYMSVSEYQDMRTNYGVKAMTTIIITEGSYYQDPYAKSNIANAQAAKMYVNGYHFARYNTAAEAVTEGNFAGRVAQAVGLPVSAVLRSTTTDLCWLWLTQ